MRWQWPAINNRGLRKRSIPRKALDRMIARYSLYNKWREAGFAFWLLTAFLILVLFTGGSSRPDEQSLSILRPAAILVCGVAISTLQWEQVQRHKLLLGGALALLIGVSAYVIPFMPVASGISPEHNLLSEINAAANISPELRAISLAPTATLNALFALFVPLAVLLLSIQLNKEEKFLLLPVLIILIALSGIWGTLQALASTADVLYLYQITSRGFAVGLFANRNHQAVLLAALLPMLAAIAWVNVKTPEQAKFRGIAAAAAAIILIPLLLVTGSRAGLALGLVALVSTAWIYRSPHSLKSKKQGLKKARLIYAIGFGGVVALGLITALTSRAEAIRRIFVPDQVDNIRFQSWRPIADIASGLVPTGAGPGAFSVIFQIHEPMRLLRGGYLNQAHNDYLDLYLTAGISGIGLAVIAVISTLYLGWRAFFSRKGDQSRNVVYGKVGAMMLLLVLLASISDYPLRVPTIACFVTIAMIWVTKESFRSV